MTPLTETLQRTSAFRRARAARHASGPCLSSALRADPQWRDRPGPAHHHPVAGRRVRRQRDAGARGVAAPDRGARADGHLQPLDRHSAADGRPAFRSSARSARSRIARRRLGDAQHRFGARSPSSRIMAAPSSEAARAGDNKAVSALQPRLPLHDLSGRALRRVARDHRDAVVADQPLLPSAARIRQLLQGQRTARDSCSRRFARATPPR